MLQLKSAAALPVRMLPAFPGKSVQLQLGMGWAVDSLAPSLRSLTP